MGIGTSILLIAVGAILRWAVNLHWKAGTVNWHLVGDILMVLGVVGLLVSLVWMTTANRRATRARETARVLPRNRGTGKAGRSSYFSCGIGRSACRLCRISMTSITPAFSRYITT